MISSLHGVSSIPDVSVSVIDRKGVFQTIEVFLLDLPKIPCVVSKKLIS